jgi:hypothetical protein
MPVQTTIDRSRFCVTGLPRSRTAWLAALLCAHGVETVHEFEAFFPSLGALEQWLYGGTVENPRGYVDGFAVIKNAALVKEHFRNNPIMVIRRDPEAVRRSWEKWEGPISDGVYAQYVAELHQFMHDIMRWPNLYVMPYEWLATFEAVNGLVKACTGRPLKYATWKLFNRLQIEVRRES